MATSAQSNDAMETRSQRAANEEMTLVVLGETQMMIRGNSGNAHPIQTNGTDAVGCGCKDYTYNNVTRCKHMIAYEEWKIDDVEMSGQ